MGEAEAGRNGPVVLYNIRDVLPGCLQSAYILNDISKPSPENSHHSCRSTYPPHTCTHTSPEKKNGKLFGHF